MVIGGPRPRRGVEPAESRQKPPKRSLTGACSDSQARHTVPEPAHAVRVLQGAASGCGERSGEPRCYPVGAMGACE